MAHQKYHRAFEQYWSNTWQDMGNLEGWQSSRLKQIAYRAWCKGRSYQKSTDQTGHGND